MNNSSNTSHRPDSLTGAIAAFEGINQACTLLNGPIGCKFYTSYISSLQAPKVDSTASNYFTKFFFGQSQVPCTFIDEQDFIYGTKEKLTQALKLLDSKKYELIGIINHSGTSLIGDDLREITAAVKIKTKTVPIESSGFTGTYAMGFKNAAINILGSVTKKSIERIPRSVNIIGSTIFHYNWANDIAELKRMLSLIGVNVISVICAGENLNNLEKAGQAELNLVISEEYSDTIAVFLEKEYGIPNIGLGLIPPFGLTPSETWFKSVADFFNISHESIVSESKRVRMKCYPELLRLSTKKNNLRGLKFGIFGDSSQVASLITFLYEYLGMFPSIVSLREIGTKSYEALKHYLKTNSLDSTVIINPNQYEIIECINQNTPALVFGSSIEEHLSLMTKKPANFIPISFPYYEKILLTMRPLIGFNGVLTIIEDILNSLNIPLNRSGKQKQN